MKYLTRIVIVFFLLHGVGMADELEVKINQNSINLPYWPPKTSHYGAVLIVNGDKETQWPLLLTYFSEQLAINGWSVTLLNCTKDKSVPWITQLPEVISVLRQQKNKRIVLVHYGEQLNQSLEYFSKPQAKMINGLVLLSAYDEQNAGEKIDKLRFPLFDVAGQFDYDFVLQQMKQREKEFRSNYQAIEMPGADHEYAYSQKLLVAFIHGWMTKLPETQSLRPPILVSYIEPVYSSASLIAVVDDTDWIGFFDDPEQS